MSNIDKEMIQAALKDYSDENILKYEEFERGSARTVIDVEMKSGNHRILYLCTKESIEKRFEKEQALLKKVNKETDIPTPNIVYSDFTKKTIPYSYYIGEKINGYNPVDRFKYLPEEDRIRILKQSARYLGKLHNNLAFKGFGDILYEDKKLKVDSKTCKEHIKDKSKDWINKFEENRFSDLQEKARNFVNKYEELTENVESCCVHYDVRPENLIIREDKVEAVIDWEKSISHAPEWDLKYSMILFIHSKFETEEIREKMVHEFFESYLKENQLDDRWKERLLYFNTIWTMKLMADFEEIHGENKQEMEETYRENLENRYTNLAAEAKKELPNNL